MAGKNGISLLFYLVSSWSILGFHWWVRWSRICLKWERPGFDPALGRSLGGGHGNPLQYSCLENHHGQRRLAVYSPWGCTDLILNLTISACFGCFLFVCFCQLSISILHSFFGTFPKNLFLEKISPYLS